MAEEKTPVVILGAGGYAAVVHEILNTQPDVLLIGCTDKALGISERSVGEGVTLRILGDDDILPRLGVNWHIGAEIALGAATDRSCGHDEVVELSALVRRWSPACIVAPEEG